MNRQNLSNQAEPPLIAAGRLAGESEARPPRVTAQWVSIVDAVGRVKHWASHRGTVPSNQRLSEKEC
jgi:hypothetical protein